MVDAILDFIILLEFLIICAVCWVKYLAVGWWREP